MYFADLREAGLEEMRKVKEGRLAGTREVKRGVEQEKNVDLGSGKDWIWELREGKGRKQLNAGVVEIGREGCDC